MKIENTYNLSIPTEGTDEFTTTRLTAVLTKDCQGRNAVYIGIGSPDFIIEHGLKQSYREALSYFPGLEEGEYRR